MMKPRSRANLTLLMLALLALPALFLSAGPAAAQPPACDRNGCGRLDCATPARPVQAALWGNLQPVDPNPLPAERDTTNFNEFSGTYYGRNWFFGVDIENGWVLAGLAHGIGVWDARTNPASPTFVAAKRYGPFGSFPFIPPGESSKIVFGAIDAPDDSVAAVVGYNGAGLLVFDLSNKAEPKPVYQSTDKTSESVYATTIGATKYAFMGSSSPGAVFVYSLTKAVTFNGCFEDATTPGAAQCPGVLIGQIATAGTPYFVHGTGNYLAVGFGSSRGFQIFDVSNPASPQLKLTGLRNPGGRPVNGVALWNEGSTYYLGARLGATATEPAQTAIYNVSCITGTCSSLGAPLSTKNLSSASTSEYLTFSRSGSIPFLYAGGDTSCSGSDGQQREWLLDVSNPSAPVDVTPQGTLAVQGNYGGVTLNKTINYWSAYYRGSPTGYNLVAPRAGKFIGDYFYRAGRSILDIHKITLNAPPVSDFTWSPAEVYTGTQVTFADQSSGAPTDWFWTFQDGSPSTGVTANPQVTFNSVGSKNVTLTASNALGPGSTVSKSVVVLDPTPVIASISASPASPTVCQPVTLSASGVTGAPTLFYQWKIDSINLSTATSPVWDTTNVTPGPHAVSLDVTNTSGAANKSINVNVAALSPLPGDFTFTPTNDPFTDGTVQFHVVAAGGTEWRWDFGDGAGFGNWTNDPINGPNPTHTYTTTGNKTVKVEVRNCQNLGAGQQAESSSLTINILQTTPLAAGFSSGLFCQFGACFATVGVSVPFTDSSTGAEIWDYNWDNTNPTSCSFTGPGADLNHTSPVLTHTWATASDFYPCLRVKRGSEVSATVIHMKINVAGGGGGGGGASISVSGPGSGSINTAYTYTASATGCTASSSGWSWSTSGGSGTSSSSSLAVTWASAGVKTVTATNSNCGSAQGTRAATITDPGNPGGGTLAAQFTFTPGAPNPGASVSFDANSSTGSPVEYLWTFGDGGTGSGKNVTHTFANAGSYAVKLSVSKPSTGCPFAPCVAEASITKAVVVGTPAPTVSADFSASAECINVGGFDQCQAPTGAPVNLTAAEADATYSWNFGDNATGSGRTVSHAWSQPGSYPVTLTVVKGSTTVTKTRTFVVSGAPVPTVKSVVLPWIAQTRGALVQSSDLYVHNPGTAPMEVTLEFRKRGAPESNPPRADRTIAPGATLYVADVLLELFNRENIAGFISVTVDDGPVEPVITSFNTTIPLDGKRFGQTVAGVSMSDPGTSESSLAEDALQHLVGLIDNTERLAYFGISNPSDEPVTYHLRFFDKEGVQIGESSTDLTLSRFGQRQFQSAEIHEDFGVSNEADYRVEIEKKSGGRIVPYASNLRLSSEDPSFIKPGSSKASRVYLIGVLSALGINNTLWQTDVLLTNISGQQAVADVTFTGLGVNATPTQPLHLTLPSGETERLENVISGQFGIHGSGIGVLTVSSTSANGVFPIVQGESYENTNPAKRFGQAMTAVSDADAAEAGEGQHLVGLRQDANNRTTFWLFNPPGGTQAEYDVVYRKLDGTVLGTVAGVRLGAGKMRQFSPGQHPLPTAGVADGFTVQILVKSGKVLSAAQVINSLTNDPAYIQGEVR